MECGICYQDITDHKLFRFGCCSFNMCVDCVKKGRLEKCPQCKSSYNWIVDQSKLQDEIKRLRGIEICMNNEICFLKGVCYDLNTKLHNFNIEGIKKNEHINELTNIITRLMQEQEEADNEDEVVEALQDVVNRFHLIP